MSARENNSTYLRLLRVAEKTHRTLYKEQGDNLVAAYVYGSLARGDYVESSDVDLHIVLRDYAQAAEIPHTNWVCGIPVGVAPHPLSFYKTSPEWLLENVELAGKWEGLWEIEKITILYDPSKIVSSFRDRITPILNNNLLLKARSKTSFAEAIAQIKKVKQDLRKGALDQALAHMFALGGGGDEYSGAAVHVLKTVIKFSGLPLTTRRIWLRFREACNRLNAPTLQETMEDCYRIDQLDPKNLQAIVAEAFSLVDRASAKSPLPEEAIHELGRFRLAFTEFMKSRETGAAQVYILGGFSSSYLGLHLQSGNKQVRRELRELLCETAGIYRQREIEDRVRTIQKAMHNIEKELFCGRN